jgi:TetR/AcrR family transcriptional repressor of lmrAB and yxaGH operons
MSEKRDKIIETTSELMERQGYFGTGLNQIIEESGSPKGSLYYYFPDGKDQITEEALRKVGSDVLANIEGLMARFDAAADALDALLTAIAGRIEETDYEAGGPLTTVALETAASSERLRIVCDEIYDSWKQAFVDKLRSNGASASDADAISDVILSSIEGAVVLSRTRRDTAPIEAVAAQLRRLIEASC